VVDVTHDATDALSQLSQVKLRLIKTSDNRMSLTRTMNENKIVKKSIYSKIMSQYKMSLGQSILMDRSKPMKVHFSPKLAPLV